MLAINFPEKNLVYSKPQGWTDEQYSDLDVWKGDVAIDDKGAVATTIISCWQPSKEDIDAIVAGKPIWLFITSEVQPPVSLSTEYPFVKQEQNT
jgi:hypothetical protein